MTTINNLDDFLLEDDQMLSDLTKKYFWFFRDFAYKIQQPNVVHSRNYFWRKGDRWSPGTMHVRHASHLTVPPLTQTRSQSRGKSP